MVDMWSLGITLYRMICGVTPFEKEYHLETVESILKGEFTFGLKAQTHYSQELRNFIRRLLTKRKYRLTA